MLTVVACRMRHLAAEIGVSHRVAGYPRPRGSVQLVVCVMEWSNEKTITFIDDYHNSPELWDIKSVKYKDNTIKNDRLKELSGKYVNYRTVMICQLSHLDDCKNK